MQNTLSAKRSAETSIKKIWTIEALQLPLLPLVILNLLLSAAHYVDNFIHFSEYPEPVWLHANTADAFWFILVAWLYPLFLASKNKVTNSGVVSFASGVFILLTSLSLMHYNYGSFEEMSFKMHFYIFAEVLGSLFLIPNVFVGKVNKNSPSRTLLALTVVTFVSLLSNLNNAFAYRETWVVIELCLIIYCFTILFLTCFKMPNRKVPLNSL